MRFTRMLPGLECISYKERLHKQIVFPETSEAEGRYKRRDDFKYIKS